MTKKIKKAEKHKKIIQKLIQTLVIHEAISDPTLQRVFPRKKLQEPEKINKLLQHFHNELPMECMKENNKLNQRYAFRLLALKYF